MSRKYITLASTLQIKPQVLKHGQKVAKLADNHQLMMRILTAKVLLEWIVGVHSSGDLLTINMSQNSIQNVDHEVHL